MSELTDIVVDGKHLTLFELLEILEEKNDGIPPGGLDVALLPPVNAAEDVTDEDSGPEEDPGIENVPRSQMHAEAVISIPENTTSGNLQVSESLLVSPSEPSTSTGSSVKRRYNRSPSPKDITRKRMSKKKPLLRKYAWKTAELERSDVTFPLMNSCHPPSKSPVFINNEWVDSASGETFTTINPTTGELLAVISKGGVEDVNKAVAAAKEAFKRNSPWRQMDASKRGILINRLADLMERDSVYLASLEALECGKVFSATLKGDIPWAVRNMRYFGGYADKNNGITAPIDGNMISYTRHEPVGVCGLITAWNFSTLMVSWKLAPALAAGCTMVLKPSQHSSLAALHVAELVREAGFPPGVINFVPGFGEVGTALVNHPQVDKISFTGSTEVGKQIFRNGSETMKRLTLELGGKSPNIILPDADLDSAVEHAHYAAFHNMGQCCCAGSRTFVHESIYEKFLEKTKARIKSKRVGDPLDINVDHGPQATQEQLNTIVRMIESGKKEGATLVLGGNKLDGPGFFVEPTLFTDVKDDMTIAREEIFGPVQQVMSYKTIEEVIERANDTAYGLASSIFGQNLDQINTIMQGLRAGSVWVNCYFIITPQTPFGGYKMSGIGREGGPYGINAYTEVKSVFMKTPIKNS